MSSTAIRTIIVAGNGLTKEAVASAEITPGMLVERLTDNKVQPHSVGGGAGTASFAVEDDHQGKTIDDVYAVDDRVILEYAQKGEEINAIASGAIAEGDLVASAGDGKVAKWVSGNVAIGVAKADAVADARVVIEII